MKNKKHSTIITLLILFLVVPITIVQTNTSPTITWPNWSKAEQYGDAIGDAKSDIEDMIKCYITHNSTFLFFRVEFDGSGSRNLFIYLDIDQSASTGDTGIEEVYGFNLHDLGADYRLNAGLSSGVYEYSIWRPISAIYASILGADYIEVAVELAAIGNPKFPIGILFVTSETVPTTDYTPNESHITYPRLKIKIVGGKILSNNILFVITPYLLLLMVIIGTMTVLYKKKIY